LSTAEFEHPVRVIEPPAPGVRRALAEVGHHRAALAYFVRRFAMKTIGRTFLGWAWIVLPVLIPLLLGTLVYGGILGVSVPGVPYLLYFTVASGAWIFFSRTTYLAIRSLEITRREIRRLYIPRLLPLVAAVTTPAMTLGVFVVLGSGVVAFYVLTRDTFYLDLSWATLAVPLGFGMLMAFAYAVALWFAPLAPRARDVRRGAGYVLGIWYFLTPVLYPIGQIPSGWRFLASLNPITAPIEIIKQGLIGVGTVTATGLAVYAGLLLVVGTLGLRSFFRKERRDAVHY
jgi:lipopolysaccharide transport system permease protein